MFASEYTDMDAVAIADAVQARQISPVELVAAALERLEAIEPSINACTVVCKDEALVAARALERRLTQGDRIGALAGVPLAVKDVIWMRGLPATMGTRALAHFVPTDDAAPVRRLRAAGAIVVAKTTNPPFCDAGYTESELFGVTRNPWNPDRTPGGSSGGSAAVVAGGIVPVALGTDMGGSIRGPAAFCGIVGMKPTHGLVARGPCFEEGRTLNAVGPMARTVRDVARCLMVIAGTDPAASLSAPRLALASSKVPPIRLRAAWSVELEDVAVDRSVSRAIVDAIDALTALGWRIEETHLPPFDTLAIHSTTVAGERGMTVDWRDDLLEGYARDMFATASTLRAWDYHQAQLERARYSRALESFFESYDVLLTPTVCLPASGADSKHRAMIDGRQIDVHVEPWWQFCLPANLTGCPAISVPIGRDEEGLPIGLQILCPRFQDERCLDVAAALESALPWPRLPPATVDAAQG